MEKLQKTFGERGVESDPDATDDEYRYAYRVGKWVSYSAGNTPWESKCLVRALTAQRLLLDKGIHTTMYLGVGKDENGKMIAHSWLRMGKLYVTGGNGEGYAMVDKYKR